MKEIVETIYGKCSKFEIVKETSTFGSPKFYVFKDGKPHRGSFSSLHDAVEAARDEG